jgi:hypothetical protein
VFLFGNCGSEIAYQETEPSSAARTPETITAQFPTKSQA